MDAAPHIQALEQGPWIEGRYSLCVVSGAREKLGWGIGLTAIAIAK